MSIESVKICINFRKQLIKGSFLKNVNADNLQNPVQAFGNMMDLIETGDEQIGADCDPDLGFDCVFRKSEKYFVFLQSAYRQVRFVC